MQAQAETIPVDEYVASVQGVFSRVAHQWELHSAVRLTPAEERTMVREPAKAVPDPIAGRTGLFRILVVPFVGCFKSGDAVCFSKPEGESHSAVWLASDGRTDIVLASKELDPHDTGFELLATTAQLLLPKMTRREIDSYSNLLNQEVIQGIRGEIDQEALESKEAYLAARAGSAQREKAFLAYRDTSFVSTVAEYIHGLWHDVQIRLGPEHLPVAQLRRRMTMIAEWFPPNPGYELFAHELERAE